MANASDSRLNLYVQSFAELVPECVLLAHFPVHLYPKGMLFLLSFLNDFGAVSSHVLPVPCTGKCVRKEQPDRTVCSMPMDLPLRLECEERASHKPTGIGDEVSRRTSSRRAIVSLARNEMSSGSSADDRQRAHVVRMLARARKRNRQAQKIVAKWEAKLTELNRKGVATKQPRLWQEEHLHILEDAT